MKTKGSMLLAGSLMLAVFIALVSFFEIPGGSVRGTVNPQEAAAKAFLFSGKDTLTALVQNGAFQFGKVPQGNFSLLIEATPPYRNGVKQGISVIDGEFTDAGEIMLYK